MPFAVINTRTHIYNKTQKEKKKRKSKRKININNYNQKKATKQASKQARKMFRANKNTTPLLTTFVLIAVKINIDII